MINLLLTTTNRDKIREYRQIFANTGIRLEIPADLPEVAETGQTFRANAILKARAYGQKFNRPVLADDTGLEITALNNFPGINSARFADNNFPAARKKILARVKDDRRARFVCVLALYLPAAGKVKTFTGTISGLIAGREQGRNGFGYDPIFFVPRHKKTLAQMSLKQKNLISHRSRAAAKLKDYLQELKLFGY